MNNKRPEINEAELAKVLDGSCWDEFCDSLKKVGKEVVMAADSPNNPLDRAEGWRYLARLTRAGLDSFLEASDKQAPEFRRPVHETIKIGMDNPDNIYLSAPANGEYQYRITGTRGTVHYLGFGSQAGGYGSTGGLNTTGYLEADDIKIEQDGSFEFIASKTKPESGNWLPMAEDTTMIIVRQTRLDHKNEIPATVNIERIDGANLPRAFKPDMINNALQSAAFFVHGTSAVFKQWADGFESHINELPRFDPAVALAAGGDPNIAYYHSGFELADDEALVVELTPPKCDFWNFQLGNYWLESLDYRYFPVHLNKSMAEYEDDGSVVIVVSKTDPGVKNWMNTCGRDKGTMCVRWIRADEYPQPTTRVVKLADLN